MKRAKVARSAKGRLISQARRWKPTIARLRRDPATKRALRLQPEDWDCAFRSRVAFRLAAMTILSSMAIME